MARTGVGTCVRCMRDQAVKHVLRETKLFYFPLLARGKGLRVVKGVVIAGKNFSVRSDHIMLDRLIAH